MKGKAILVLGILAIASAIVLMPNSHATTITVPTDQPTISAAVAAADNGDTIIVNQGNYSESSTITVNKSITIVANGTVRVDGKGTDPLFNITAANVNISGLEIYNATVAIEIHDTLAHIYDCNIHNNTWGVFAASGSTRFLVNNNTFSYNGNSTAGGGIYVSSSLNGCIVGNDFLNNTYDGVYFSAASGTENTIIHFNNFRLTNNYAIESAGAVVDANYNFWFDEQTGTWGGTPGEGIADNVSANVNTTVNYNGYALAAWATYAPSAGTQNIETDYDADLAYNVASAKWIVFANLYTIPIGSINGYTPLRLYKEVFVDGGIATNEWINVTLHYTSNDFPAGTSENRIKGIWHYNFTSGAWEKAALTGKNTTADTVWANFTTGLSPIVICSNKLPDPTFTVYPANISVGDVVYFDATNSTDPDGSIVKYRWDFGDTNNGGGISPSHVYHEAGNYTVVLTVTDNAGDTNTYSKDITVRSYAPPVAPGAGVAPGNGRYTLTVTVTDASGTPVSGAFVNLYSNGMLLGTAITNANGVATFNNVEGTYRITAEKSGYETADGYVTVTEDTSATLILHKAVVTTTFMGMSMYGFIVVILTILGLVTMLLSMLSKSYKKYYMYAIILFLIATVLAGTFMLISIQLNTWMIVLPLALLLVTIALNWDEFKRDIKW